MRKFRMGVALILVALLALAGCGGKETKKTGQPAAPTGSTAPAQPAPVKEKMTARVGIGSTNSLIYLSVPVATELKLFDKEGLVIERPNFKGGAQIAQALVEGNLDFALFSYNHVIKYQTQGIDLASVAMIAELPGSALVVDARHKDKIKSIEDLKGLKVGITSPGSGSHDALLSMLGAAGLNAKDVEVVGVGFDLAKAFEEGKVTVGVTYEPFVSILTESGRGVLLTDPRTDLRTVEGVRALYGTDRYPMTTLVTSRSLIQKNPELVQRMVSAIVAANNWISARSPEEIAAVVPDSDKGDPAYYVAALKAAKAIIAVNGAMHYDTVEAVVKDLKASKSIPESASIDVKAVVEERFVTKVAMNK